MGFHNIINYPSWVSLFTIFGDLGLELTAAAFFWPVYTLYFISFMPADNLNYILNNNQEFEKKKLKVNPNSFELNVNALSFENDPYIKYNIPKYRAISIFGGNLDFPQHINFINANIVFCKSIKDVLFLIVGEGIEYKNLSNQIKNVVIVNTLLLKELPKLEYNTTIKIAHVRLIFLNPLFTIPNFQFSILSYIQNYWHAICARDLLKNIGKISFENNFVYKYLTSDFKAIFEYVFKLLDRNLTVQMDQNGLDFLKNKNSLKNSFSKIVYKL